MWFFCCACSKLPEVRAEWPEVSRESSSSNFDSQRSSTKSLQRLDPETKEELEANMVVVATKLQAIARGWLHRHRQILVLSQHISGGIAPALSRKSMSITASEVTLVVDDEASSDAGLAKLRGAPSFDSSASSPRGLGRAFSTSGDSAAEAAIVTTELPVRPDMSMGMEMSTITEESMRVGSMVSCGGSFESVGASKSSLPLTAVLSHSKSSQASASSGGAPPALSAVKGSSDSLDVDEWRMVGSVERGSPSVSVAATVCAGAASATEGVRVHLTPAVAAEAGLVSLSAAEADASWAEPTGAEPSLPSPVEPSSSELSGARPPEVGGARPVRPPRSTSICASSSTLSRHSTQSDIRGTDGSETLEASPMRAIEGFEAPTKARARRERAALRERRASRTRGSTYPGGGADVVRAARLSARLSGVLGRPSRRPSEAAAPELTPKPAVPAGGAAGSSEAGECACEPPAGLGASISRLSRRLSGLEQSEVAESGRSPSRPPRTIVRQKTDFKVRSLMRVGGGRVVTSLVSQSGMGPMLKAVNAVLRKGPECGACRDPADGPAQAKRLMLIVQKLALCVGTGHISEETLQCAVADPLLDVCCECVEKNRRVDSAAEIRAHKATLFSSGLMSSSMKALMPTKKKKEKPAADPHDPKHERLIRYATRLGDRLVQLMQPHLSHRSISELDCFFDFITSVRFIETFFSSEQLRPERELIIDAMSESYNLW